MVNVVEYNHAAERILVGLEDGILDILKIKNVEFEDIVCSKIHQSKITGIYYDNLNGIVYTCS
jgi:hypothetical protein